MHRQYSLISSRSPKKMPVHLMKEARWVRRLCAEDATAWTQLIEHWSPRLYNYVFYNVATEADAQALMHAIFTEIVQVVVGSLRIANLTILLFATARQHVLRYRAQSAHVPPPTHPLLLSAERPTNQQLTSFWVCFQKFTLELQQILLLYYVCGVSLPEISQIVGRQEGELLRILQQAKYYLLRT